MLAGLLGDVYSVVKKPITPLLIGQINEVHISGLNFEDGRLPTGICLSCRFDIRDAASVELPKKKHPLPDVFHYSLLVNRVHTRETPIPSISTVCDVLVCLVCKIVKEPPKNLSKHNQKNINTKCTWGQCY
jgi:hypothetical protein